MVMLAWASKGWTITGPWTLSVPLPGSDAESVRAAGPRTGHVKLSTPISTLFTGSWTVGDTVSSEYWTLPVSFVRSTAIFHGWGAGPLRAATAGAGAALGA